jgi:hypothetical protein
MLKAAATAPIAALAAKAAGGHTIAAGRGVFLYDAAAPLSFVYGSARGGSVETIALHGDISEAWRSLDRRLAARPFILAGVTTPEQFFCIQILASGRRLQAVARGGAPASVAAAGTAMLASEPALAPVQDDARHFFWSFAPIAHIA